MEQAKICRRCLLRDTLDESAYRQTVVRIRETMNPRLRAPDEEYERRLELCTACEELQNGTCMQCGCLVEMRAMRLNNHCPMSQKRW